MTFPSPFEAVLRSSANGHPYVCFLYSFSPLVLDATAFPFDGCR